MRIVLGIVFVVFGGFGYLTQLISGISYPLAQRLGFQESSEDTDPLYRRAEANTARWDTFVLWTLLVTGILMLTQSSLWPYLALVAGGIYLDAGGREAARYLSLRKEGIRVGNVREVRTAFVFFPVMSAIGLLAVAYAAWSLA